ncbi:PMEI domain-containing protein [Heracleum sosnowskyi]|uniref:PMEI domain-containing protein n=1 Tax=Heracleum sosnowskyi TaxID=360622 RepID=A0AAD8IH86_9APIA|nr:PMEI domain-containing protein [Heracleum sosnowskyi]
MSHIMTIFLSLTILALLTYSASSENGDDYVQDACSVTRYRNLCIRSLSPFSTTAKRNPTTWARAGVSVTISEAKRVAKLLTKLSTSTGGRNKGALLDCIECFEDSIDNLHKSLYVLRELNGQTFNSQMSDVTTWMSAALTDEDTCLDGFSDHKGRKIKSLQNRITNVTYITSNALALVNKLATTGISDP